MATLLITRKVMATLFLTGEAMASAGGTESSHSDSDFSRVDQVLQFRLDSCQDGLHFGEQLGRVLELAVATDTLELVRQFKSLMSSEIPKRPFQGVSRSLEDDSIAVRQSRPQLV